MQRRLFRTGWLGIVTAVSCILLTTLNASAYTASHAMPNTVDCSKGCHSEAYWNGTTYGGATQFTISNPGIDDKIGYFNRFLRLQMGSDYPRLEIGISKTKGGGYGDYCAGIGSGLHYFIYLWDFKHYNSFNYCNFVPSADVNSDVSVSAVEDSTCSTEFDGLADEMAVSIYSANFSTTQCVDTEAGWFTREVLREDMVDHVNGHHVWGSHWILSQWVDSDTNFVWQTRNTDNSPVSQNPPQMYWQRVPAPGNNGGILYSCDYDTGLLCTYRS